MRAYSLCKLSFCLDGYVIGHYANNARDFLYPAVPPYPGSGRELTLFKTSLFNPIRITVSISNFDGKSKTTYLQPSLKSLKGLFISL